MANTINYAEKWEDGIIEIINQETLTSPFITTNVDWLNAKTFHFTQMAVSGFKNRALASKTFNSGDITQTDVPFTLTHDRDIEFVIDKREFDESNNSASVSNTGLTFTRTQHAPEVDAYAFSKVATQAIALGAANSTNETLASFTVANVYTKLVEALGKSKLKYYRQRGSLIGYVRSEIMDLLALSNELNKEFEVTTLSEDGKGVETRVVNINGVNLIEVIDTDRFNTSFDYTDGFVADGFEINMMFASVETVKTVPKIADIFMGQPDNHNGGNYTYAERAYWDTFVMPNGLNNAVDSIYVSYEGA